MTVYSTFSDIFSGISYGDGMSYFHQGPPKMITVAELIILIFPSRLHVKTFHL